MKKKNNNKNLKIALVFLIIIILGYSIYALYIKPKIEKSSLDNQIDGCSKCVNNILAIIVNDIEQRGYTQINMNNKTLILIPYGYGEVKR